MRKTFKLGLIVGRFQHFHIGHKRMVDTALATCERVLLLVGSSQESMTVRNPYTLKTRMDLIRDLYENQVDNGYLLLGHIDDMTNESDICVEWGDFVLQKSNMWAQHYGLEGNFDCMIFGNDEDRAGWFRPEVTGSMSQIIIDRKVVGISATKMRDYMIDDDFESWIMNMPAFKNESRDYMEDVDLEYWYDRLTTELLYVPHYKEMLENA